MIKECQRHYYLTAAKTKKTKGMLVNERPFVLYIKRLIFKKGYSDFMVEIDESISR
ncbi:hypothetical protein PCURB6_28210 [Paenibacillus curdlanolyticus]|nr:hypothetical protein PCURB6_28210 [Paenibacillus curdlanolyticus]